MRQLQRMASEFGIAVVVTNQVAKTLTPLFLIGVISIFGPL